MPSGKREVYLSVLEYRCVALRERENQRKRRETDEDVVEIDPAVEESSLRRRVVCFRQQSFLRLFNFS